MKERINKLVSEYGVVAALLWFSIFAATWVGFAFAIQLGYQPETRTSTAGVWGVAYLATQLTKPLRLAATLALTPIVGWFWKRRKPQVEDIDASEASQ